MKVAILADFPIHLIPELADVPVPQGHYPTWLPQLARQFASVPGVEAHWVVNSIKVSAAREVTWQNQTFHILKAWPWGRATTLFKDDRRQIAGLLRRLQPDLVHGWGSEDVHGLAAARSRLPNIVSMQGILSHYALRNKMHPREYFQALLELYVLRKASRITVESEWGRKLLLRRAPRAHVSLVEYGVNDPFFDVRWKPDPLKPVAMFVGTIEPRKGIHDLVAAFRDPMLAGAELWVLGSGAEAWVQRLRQSAPTNVKWLGRRPAKEIAALLSNAWCLVLPTRADTSPNVVKEARVVGLPVVTTPCGGQTAYVEHGKNGFLVEPGDVASLSRYLSEILGDIQRCRQLGAFDHEKHRHILHPSHTAQSFHRLYQELLHQG